MKKRRKAGHGIGDEAANGKAAWDRGEGEEAWSEGQADTQERKRKALEGIPDTMNEDCESRTRPEGEKQAGREDSSAPRHKRMN